MWVTFLLEWFDAVSVCMCREKRLWLGVLSCQGVRGESVCACGLVIVSCARDGLWISAVLTVGA